MERRGNVRHSQNAATQIHPAAQTRCSMKDDDLLRLAAAYLKEKRVGFVDAGRVVRREPEHALISYPVPESLDPMAICDPQDVRVRVKLDDGTVSPVLQM